MKQFIKLIVTTVMLCTSVKPARSSEPEQKNTRTALDENMKIL